MGNAGSRCGGSTASEVSKATRWSNSCKMKARSMKEKSLWDFLRRRMPAEKWERTPVKPLWCRRGRSHDCPNGGEIEQYHLWYSAVNGRKLYEYARAGEEVDRPVRQVTIYEFTRTSEIGYEEGLARFRFRQMQGHLYPDLVGGFGSKTGHPAHMSHLTRTSAAGLSWRCPDLGRSGWKK